MLSILKENSLVLPIRKKIYEKRFANHENVNYFRGVFESFSEAAASAPRTKPSGYDNSDAAKMYKERIHKPYSTDYPVLFWMEKFKNEFTTIFDFGGHIGVHYYSYPKVLELSRLSKWTVCDVESVCKEGEKFAQDNDAGRKLNFVTDIVHCEGYDLFIANGSLQYLEWELHSKLKEISDKPKFLIINMTPLHPTAKTITLNSIGTAFCPYHLRKEVDFFNGLSNAGYEIIDIWNNEEKACSIAFESERSINYYRGAILKLKK